MTLDFPNVDMDWEEPVVAGENKNMAFYGFLISST